MKVFHVTAKDNELERLRVEFNGEDMDTVEGLLERLQLLLEIEQVLDVVSVRSPFILGQDVPTETAAGILLLKTLLAGWYDDPEDPFYPTRMIECNSEV